MGGGSSGAKGRRRENMIRILSIKDLIKTYKMIIDFYKKHATVKSSVTIVLAILWLRQEECLGLRV